MSEKRRIRPDLIHEVGGGQAAFELHGPNWLGVNCDVNLTDANPDVLTPYKGGVPDVMRDAYAKGHLTFRRLGELAATPGIIDITTASGRHVEAVHQTLEELEICGVSGSQLTWLIEKPVTSSDEERHQLAALFAEGHLDINKTFVNENYLASKGLKYTEMLIAMEIERGTTVNMVDVVFNKNRKPDVDNGRFTDPVLGAYGIEMPHQLAIAYRLAGVSAQEAQPQILHNHHYDEVHGVSNSQGSYTVVQVANGVVIRMAQGLGPYTMQANGDIIPRDDQPIERYADVTLSDGRQIRVEFTPVEGLGRSTARVTWQNSEGQWRQEILEDKVWRSVMGGIATFAATGVRPYFADDLSVPNAFAYTKTLGEFAANANG